MKILCVEDDENLARLLKAALISQHYQVEVALDGLSAWNLAEAFTYDLILLDWMLPGLDGIRFCQRLRSYTSSTSASPNQATPVLLMTALDAVTNKVMGLDAGADDYVTKPLDFDELMARIRALLRRNQTARSPVLQWGDLCLNPTSCEVTFRGQPVLLASKEYEILELFLRNPDQIFSPSRLLDRLWASEDAPTEGAVRSHIKGLRQKLKQAGSDEMFETLYKLGYRLKPQLLPRNKRHEAEGARLTPSSIAPELWAAWQECRQDYCDRLAVVHKAAVALQAGTLSLEQKRMAEREAHTLIGSLGSFGLQDASHLCRQIQQHLQQVGANGANLPEGSLLQLIAALRHQLEQFQHPPDVSADQARNSPASRTPLPADAATLLIVDDDPALANQLATEASLWQIQANAVTTLQQARHSLSAHRPDAILLDLNFSDSNVGGLEFLSEVRSRYGNIPVLILTAEENFTRRVEANRLGCQWFLQKPIAPTQVLATIAQVMQPPARSAGRLLIVDDDSSFLQLLHRLLTPQGYEVTLLDRPDAFWQTLEQTAPDLVILDIDLQSYDAANVANPLNGIDLCQVIRSDPRWHRLPVLLLSAHTDAETVYQGYAARADDFLNKPIVAAELLTRIQARLQQRKLWS